MQKTFAGAVVAGKSNPSFENCKFFETSKYGIVFTENAGGALKNADITGSVRGIIVEKKAAPLITNTKVHHNEEAGVTFYGEAKGHLENVESYSNTTGFSINDSTYPVITHSKAYSNNTGFLSSENNKAVIADCDSFRNNASGGSRFTKTEAWHSRPRTSSTDAGSMRTSGTEYRFEERSLSQ